MENWEKTVSQIEGAITWRAHGELTRLLSEIDPNDKRFKLHDLPLLLALEQGTPETVEIVLKAGADPNGRGLSLNALWKSPEYNTFLDKLVLLMEYGALPEKIAEVEKVDFEKFSALITSLVKRSDADKLWEKMRGYLLFIEENLPEGWRDFLLEKAAYYRRGKLLEKLYQEGFDFSVRLYDGQTLLHRWARGVSEAYWDSLSYYDQYIRTPQEENWKETVLALEVLISAGLDVNDKDEQGYTPLHHACVCAGRSDILTLLLERGANPQIKDQLGRTPAFLLPVYASDSLKLLLKHGADSNAKSSEGIPLLINATLKRTENPKLLQPWISFLKTLLENGADPRERDNEERTFLQALFKNLTVRNDDFPREDFYDLVKEALKRGASPNEFCCKEKITWYILHYATSDPGLTKILLEWGADPNARNYQGETPAHWAAMGENAFEVLVALKEAGADLRARDGRGRSIALNYIISRENFDLKEIKRLNEIGLDFKDENILFYLVANWPLWDKDRASLSSLVRFLVQEIGLSPNSRDSRTENGLSPLHIACKGAREDIVRLLVGFGAKTWIKDSWGKTPGDYLVDRSHKIVSAYPKWAVKLGILPLKEEAMLFELLKDEEKLRGAKSGIKKFIRGLFQEDPLAAMSLFPQLLSLPSDNVVAQIAKETVQNKTKKLSLDNNLSAEPDFGK